MPFFLKPKRRNTEAPASSGGRFARVDDAIRAKAKPQAADSRNLTRLRRQCCAGARTAAICPGGEGAIPTASGSARSCCSRRPSSRSSPISSGFWLASPRWQAWPQPTSMTCCDYGRGSAITAGPATCTRPRGRSCASTPVMIPGDVATLQTLPGIGRYTAGAIASLAYDRPHRSWRPTRYGFICDFWPTRADRFDRRAKRHLGICRTGSAPPFGRQVQRGPNGSGGDSLHAGFAPL